MKNKTRSIPGFIILFLCAVSLDQITKYLALKNLKEQEPFVLIKNIFEFIYTENRGAAFGILQGRQIFFYVITAVVVAAILVILHRMPDDRKYLPLTVSLVFILAGAFGNLIDRIVRHYVVDFIYFMPIDFPVFNMADIYVTLSTIALVLMLLFRYEEDDLKVLSEKRKND